MSDLQNLEKRVEEIEQRNRRVEGDKAWETSLTRKGVVLGLTYLVVGIYLQSIGFVNPWINVIVPAIGFFLSTLTLSIFKNLWIKYFYRR